MGKEGMEKLREAFDDMQALRQTPHLAAERARRRDEFAKAALTGLIAGQNVSREQRASEAVWYADEVLAALDATAGPTSVSAPPSPRHDAEASPTIATFMPPMRAKDPHGMESDPVLVTTGTGTQLIGRRVHYHGWDRPVWATMDNVVIHGVVGWQPVDWGAGAPQVPGGGA